MIALVDGDVMTYACGFAAEEVSYEVDLGSKSLSFKYKKEVDEWVAENNINPEAIQIERVVNIPPASHSLHNCRQLIEQIMERIKATDIKIYLTGKDNFRESVATIKGYKAHRDKDAKPAHYKDLKKYLIKTWGAIVVDGMEADDAMAIQQMEYYDNLDDWTCICTIDKDLNQVPGWHYNWKNDDFYLLTREQAIRYYAYQMLVGDPTDNIMGVPGIGPKKAEKLLDGVKLDLLPNVLKEIYQNKFTPKVIKELGIPESYTWETIYDEMDKLVRIKWYEDD